jgi:hypothetical protein
MAMRMVRTAIITETGSTRAGCTVTLQWAALAVRQSRFRGALHQGTRYGYGLVFEVQRSADLVA